MPTASVASLAFIAPHICHALSSAVNFYERRNVVVCPTPARNAISVPVGGDADDQCECASGLLSGAGECGESDGHTSVIDAATCQ